MPDAPSWCNLWPPSHHSLGGLRDLAYKPSGANDGGSRTWECCLSSSAIFLPEDEPLSKSQIYGRPVRNVSSVQLQLWLVIQSMMRKLRMLPSTFTNRLNQTWRCCPRWLKCCTVARCCRLIKINTANKMLWKKTRLHHSVTQTQWPEGSWQSAAVWFLTLKQQLNKRTHEGGSFWCEGAAI